MAVDINSLVAACQNGDFDTVSNALLSDSQLVHYKDAENISLLHWASTVSYYHPDAKNGHLRIVLLLLEKGCQVDQAGGELNATALHWAARYILNYAINSLN